MHKVDKKRAKSTSSHQHDPTWDGLEVDVERCEDAADESDGRLTINIRVRQGVLDINPR